MQRMHQSYKYMKAQQKKLSGCASNLLAHEDLGHLRKPIVGIYKPSSIMKNSHQYMKVTTQETLYHEDHGATLKHKCGKRIVTLSLLSFSLIFLFGPFLFFYGLFSFSFFLFFSSGVSSRLVGESQSPSSFPHLGQSSKNDDHHTFLFTYNSTITTQYLEQNMTLCECLRRCTGICNESRVTCMEEL